ncbi:MAG: hypothetical protein ACRDQZ_01720 [Mycobacteriales bacterium]
MVHDKRAARRAFREFVKTHHPDTGGDPTVFMAGLDRLRSVSMVAAADGNGAADNRTSRPRGGSACSAVTFYRRRGAAHQVWVSMFAAIRGVIGGGRPPRVR